LLIDLSRNQGVTIFISTHFMNEAARCDRISLMDSGRVLATDKPSTLMKARGAATLEGAFISYIEEANPVPSADGDAPVERPQETVPRRASPGFSLRRLFAYSRREGLELARDPIRLSFALI